jgi:hypothetical protein
MSWFTVIKNEIEVDDGGCCDEVVRDFRTYFMPFWDDLPVNFPTNVFPSIFTTGEMRYFKTNELGVLPKDSYLNRDFFQAECDTLIQILENIENDGTLIWLNRVHGKSWQNYAKKEGYGYGDDSPSHSILGIASDMQKMVEIILSDYRKCSSEDNKYLGDLR